ncbi:hypothetical protein L484_024907 [Morus notabilis]|uniref:Uncharacterized protein n=1 Tax=Morus notabilis TaxID=981085 RepID=W9R386_9ROSA|nr:hypothetical protein L484_024907 [Morus notabilis]
MKHFMQPRNTILRETTIEFLASPNPSTAKPQLLRKRRGSKENAPSSGHRESRRAPRRPLRCRIRNRCSRFQSTRRISAAKLKSPLPPQPPSSNPLKRKLSMERIPENSVIGTCESGVQVKFLGCGLMKSPGSKIVAFG